MKRNHYLILGGIALVAGYLWYKNDKKRKEDKAKGLTSVAPVSEETSNASGTICTCDNGFRGYCQTGDCNSCCGSYNKQKQRYSTDIRAYQQAKPTYAKSVGVNY